MKKRGFTLIELLAVIVILAVIALIATPIVMNTIEESRRKSAEVSMDNIEAAADLYYMNNRVLGNKSEVIFTCKDGSCSNGTDTLEINGTVPDEGTITIETDGTVTFNNIIIGKYLCSKTGDTFACFKTEGRVNEEYTGSIITLNNTKERTLLNYKLYGNSVQSRLPEEYQEVEYIESTGTQYIDTGIIPNQDTGFDILFLTKNGLNETSFGSIMGAREGGSTKEYQLTTYSANANYEGTLRFGTNSLNAGLTINAKMHVTLKNKKYTNDIDVNHTLTGTFKSPSTLTVFALNQNGSIIQNGSLQLYSLKLYNGNNLIRDYIPCYRKSDNVLGLYDMVENKFYVNQGTGTFIKGKEVPNPENPQEIKTVGNLITEGEHAGKYEIPITVTGKNLFNIEEYVSYIDISKYEIGDNLVLSLKDEYILKIASQAGASAILQVRDTKMAFTMTQEYKSIGRLYIISTKTYSYETKENLLNQNVQLEYGIEPTNYEPYKATTYSIYLNEPLRKVGDYADYIDFGQGKVIRYLKQSTIMGEMVASLSVSAENNVVVIKEVEDIKMAPNWNSSKDFIMSNFFGIMEGNIDRSWQETRNKYKIGLAVSRKVVWIGVGKDTTTVEKAKIYLDNIKPKLIYVLETPQTSSIDLPQIKLNNGITNIIIGTETSPSNLVIDYYK